MDYTLIRKQIIISIFSVDELFEKMVLKGGNALAVHGINSRTSKDIDLSIEKDWKENEKYYSEIIKKSLFKHFDEIDLYMFDYNFLKKPKNISKEKEGFWGGYKVVFKLIDKKLKEKLEKKAKNPEKLIDSLRKQAQKIGKTDNSKKFHIDISKYEVCYHKVELSKKDFDFIPVHIYSKSALVIEKLRAICQQSVEYQKQLKVSRRPRARDFYDIHEVIETSYKNKIDDPIFFFSDDDLNLVEQIFKIKKVPLKLLKEIEIDKDFHESDSENLFEVIAIGSNPKEFEYYFNYVVDLAKKLLERIKKRT